MAGGTGKGPGAATATAGRGDHRTDPPGGAAVELPNGLDNLRAHNLLSYKSKREPLDDWALDELVGHYVTNRKLIGPKAGLVPESDFQLYASPPANRRG